MSLPSHSIYIGFDPRESAGFAVTKHSARRHLITPVPIYGLVLSSLRAKGLYTRPTSVRDGRLWDDISGAPCATEFSISRFLAPVIAKTDWAIFMDSDMLVRSNMEALFKQFDPSKAVMCVKHNFQPPEGVKMDHQIQTRYARKNWSSMCAFNTRHPANKALTVEMVNTLPGRDLHAFSWLDDGDIGELDCSWNWLVGHSDPDIEVDCAHFTDGLPFMAGYEDCAFASEWWQELSNWAM